MKQLAVGNPGNDLINIEKQKSKQKWETRVAYLSKRNLIG